MGADFYDSSKTRAEGLPKLGIGRNCRIENAIIDKNARIGDGVTITPEGKPPIADPHAAPVLTGDNIRVWFPIKRGFFRPHLCRQTVNQLVAPHELLCSHQ
jgi:NDP-sugar pyrophosphorylase family protein